MSVLVNQQDEIINNIDVQAAKVEDDTRQGYARLIFIISIYWLTHVFLFSLDETEKAVKHARSARRKRWICFFIFLLVIAIVAIVLGVVFGKK
jgi:syntaxin 1B/2/3